MLPGGREQGEKREKTFFKDKMFPRYFLRTMFSAEVCPFVLGQHLTKVEAMSLWNHSDVRICVIFWKMEQNFASVSATWFLCFSLPTFPSIGWLVGLSCDSQGQSRCLLTVHLLTSHPAVPQMPTSLRLWLSAFFSNALSECELLLYSQLGVLFTRSPFEPWIFVWLLAFPTQVSGWSCIWRDVKLKGI